MSKSAINVDQPSPQTRQDTRKDGDRFGRKRRASATRHGSLFSGHGSQLVTDLRKGELRKLTAIFHIDNTKDKRTEQLVKQLIQELPKQLRRDRWIRTSKALCDTHQELNANLTHEIFWLVQREVGHHLVKFDAYPELLKPLDKVIVAQLKSIRGMWEKPAADCASEPGAWIYETSKCQACMLARIASDKETLRNLRTALLSRTQTRVNHVRRRLMKFVDSCIDHFQEDLDEMHSVSSYFAHIFKATRKACTKAWYMDPAHADTRQLHRHHKIGDKDLDKPGKEGSDGIHKCAKKCHPQAPPVILETHPAERCVGKTPISYVARPPRY